MSAIESDPHFTYIRHFFRSSHSVSNPDVESERHLLQQLAPEVDTDTLRRLVAAFQDLRHASDAGKLLYPYSLRGELKYKARM